MKLLSLLTVALITATSSALAEQRDFPTGEPGSIVTYLDAGGPGHPTACVVSISAGLPLLAISFALFSNNNFTLTVASQQPIPNVASGSSATMRVNSIYIFSKVTSAAASGSFHVITLAPPENESIKTAYDAINQIVSNEASVDVVADDAQLPSITLSAEPGLRTTVEACQRYLLDHL
jgi:hypothetical protein